MLYLILLLAVYAASAQETQNVYSGGATFPFEAYRLIFANFELLSDGITVTYDVSSSAYGEAAMIDGDMDFTGTDIILQESQYEDYPGLQMLPSIAGAVTVVINLPDYLDNGWNMVLDANTVSKVFRGEITSWNDDAILNYNLGYCSSWVGDIAVFVRADGAGTTEVFTKWLTSADTAWANDVGVTKQFPTDLNPTVEAFTKFSSSSAMVEAFLVAPGAMSFMAYADVFGLNTGYVVSLINSAGVAVLPNYENIVAAVSEAVFDERFNSDIIDQPVREAWPMTAFSYLLINKDDCYSTVAALSVLNWYYASAEATNLMQLTGFAPVPQETRIEALDIIRALECEGALILEVTIRDERANVPALVLFLFIMYGVIALLSVVGYANYLLIFNNEADEDLQRSQRLHHLHGFLCVVLLNIGVLPWFLSPDNELCRLRLSVFVTWAVILSFFNQRADRLNGLLNKNRRSTTAQVEAFLSISLVLVEITYVIVWIFVLNVRRDSEIIDPVSYTGREFCTSDNWNGIVIGQLAIIIGFTFKILNSIYTVIVSDSISRRVSRKLMVACGNMFASIFVAVAYAVAQENLLDLDYFIIVAVLNFLGFAPLFLSLIEFNSNRLKQTISGSKDSQTSRGPNNNSLQSIQEPSSM